MSPPNNNDNNTEAGFLVRLIVLEKQLENLEKAHNKATEVVSGLVERVNSIKYNCQSDNISKDTVANIEKDLKSLEEKVATIRVDISEISVFKRIGWLIVSFIIVSMLGFVFNSSLLYNKSSIGDRDISSEDIGKKLDDISEKLSREYKK